MTPMRRTPTVTLAGLLACGSWASAEPPRRELEILSPVYTVEGVYKSMTGPQTTRQLQVLPDGPPELIWITGYRAEMVGADGSSPLSQEFMCHSNLDLDIEGHRARFGWQKNPTTRLFTLSQGQQQIRFPPGFGIPIYTDERLDLTTQVLNLNHAQYRPGGETLQVRHRVTLEFVFDRDLETLMRPLFLVGASGLVLLEGDTPYYGEQFPDREYHGSGCMAGANAGPHTFQDHLGRSFSGHWVVPPGRQINRTLVTHFMNLPFDTTAHAIAVHLHPFAQSLELRDITTGTTVFKSAAVNPTGRLGLESVESLQSEEGIPLYKDHQYELVSVYENTTAEDQDSMASMFLYVLDPDQPPRN